MIGRMRTSRSGETTAPDRRSALASGILTGLSSLVLSASGAVAAAILAQKFGRDAGTDGLLAAYGVYVTLVLAAQALRLTAVPELTRTEGAVAGSYAAAILVVGLPSTILVWLFAEPFAELLTGKLPQEAADLAASALPWLVAAAFVQVLAALAAATLAARNRFGAAALGFSAGGVAGLVVFVVLADEHGLVALAWGLAANAAISLGVPLAALGGTLGAAAVRGSRQAAGAARRSGRGAARAASSLPDRAPRGLGDRGRRGRRRSRTRTSSPRCSSRQPRPRCRSSRPPS